MGGEAGEEERERMDTEEIHPNVSMMLAGKRGRVTPPRPNGFSNEV